MPRILLPHPRAELVRFYGTTAIDGLGALAEVRLNELDRHFTRPELVAAAEGCEIIMSFGVTPGEAELFEALPDLVAFMRWAVDYRNVDIAAASRHGILVTNGLAGFEAGVSELIIGLMLSLSRRIAQSDASYHQGIVPPATLGPELRGATIGIIGFGQIGRYLAKLALAFGMRVVITDPYATVEDEAVRQVTMDELLSVSDHVVCLATATPDTENLMCAETFGKMKPTAFFINLSRGNLVNEDDLVKALDKGTIAGCALDVGRAARQMPTPAVAAHPKILATPHIGGLTPQAVEFQSLRVIEQAKAILAGALPERAINADAATRFRQRVSR
ncbi:NAD(P)-dependent oxidoreductase [Shinella sp.]|uniref:NAD(P)-dependent oxidoreductase n=1 Tax=Shinella sp. TaxID=1870904 RepID=UPI003F715955